MRRALLLSSILPPLAVAGASILLRHHIERSVPLEGAHRHPFPPQHLPLQPPLSPPVGRCACALISLLFRLLQVTVLGVSMPSFTEFYKHCHGVFGSFRICRSSMSFRSVSVAGAFFSGCSRGRFCTVLAIGGRIFCDNITFKD